jgi:hypothetical protein
MKGFEKKDSKSSESLLRDLHRLEQINHLLNELNIEIHKVIREEDTSFVSRTMLDSPPYFGQNVVVLRAHHDQSPDYPSRCMKEIIHAQNRIGVKIYKTSSFTDLRKSDYIPRYIAGRDSLLFGSLHRRLSIPLLVYRRLPQADRAEEPAPVPDVSPVPVKRSSWRLKSGGEVDPCAWRGQVSWCRFHAIVGN